MTDYQRCTRCVMDTSDLDISFKPNGQCCHCDYYDKLRKERTEYAPENFDQLVARIKERGKGYPYDCVAGISGGTDSSYMLHMLKDSGLRVLAMHYDSGWNTEEANHNVRSLVEKLGLDLHIFKVDWEEFKALQLAYLKAGVIDLDVPTDHALHGSLYQTAAEKKAPFILTGHNMSTEIVMPKQWVTDKLDSRNLLDIYKTHGGTVPLKTFPLQTMKKKFYNYNVLKIEMIFILNYLDYNKEEASSELKRLYDWERVRVKHGESIWTRFYQCHILKNRWNADKRLAHLSNLILSGVITRDEALEQLKLPAYLDNLEEDKKIIFNRFGISDEEFEQFMNQPKRYHEDFKTEKALKDFYNKIRTNTFLKKRLKASTRH